VTAELLAWLTAAGACGVAVIAFLPWFRGSINHDMFVMMVKKLLTAGNAERAHRLCKAAPFAPFVKACDASLTAFFDVRDEPESERVHRIRAAFDGALRTELARVSRTAWLAMVAVALGGVAVYLVVGEGASPYALALVGLALLAIAQARQIGLRIALAASVHRDPLIEAMLRGASAS